MRQFNKAILIAVAALCLNLSLSAQDISLNISNITVKEAMEQLKKTSGYSFVFSSVDVNTKKRVSISVENATIETVVNLILKGQDGLSYEIRDKK
ncbi:MAG: STN domain-containing protein, partial [Prevotellaceae bacterium]|nr:STN domain-containing protein [Prevotellaceae bacterium]